MSRREIGCSARGTITGSVIPAEYCTSAQPDRRQRRRQVSGFCKFLEHLGIDDLGVRPLWILLREHRKRDDGAVWPEGAGLEHVKPLSDRRAIGNRVFDDERVDGQDL